MWLILAFCSAALLGFYDVFKKLALRDNAVLPVLFLNTMICSLLFLPFILLSTYTGVLDGSTFFVETCGWHEHKYIVLKALIVLSSWVFGYFAMKNLPITIVGPINATRPVMVLVGAMLVFGERLKHNKWIFSLVLAAVLGAVSGLYDKYLMASPDNGGVGLSRMVVQSWYNIYQLFMMGLTMLLIWWPTRNKTTKFQWRWSIIFISIFLSIADFVYFYALSLPGAMISIVSMVRRGSVVVSFFCGAAVFKEKNLRSKAVDMLLVLLGMIFLYIGTR